ncbi:hypothetical protein BCR44DRAFT_1295695 [Catenaria anguillulae PL171]|uniref:Uncharacterized protein n=1 Tax=Catenaria anguillulae PL171 TaxID=765915 RepID=A0A1Y2HXX7_9FUNG|nr:hypothetical protein BCR44DRAFT_1295695 [Catenaria anguillulae PL171]
MTTTSTKAPVLVILPPSHACPDLTRVLKLARKAFDDLSLNILDLNLRFAWVSGDELQADEENTVRVSTPAAPAASTMVSSSPPAPAPAPTPMASFTEPANAISPAPIDSMRLLVMGFAPTLSDAQILQLAPHNVTISSATFYPPRPIGPNNSMVRSAAFAFSNPSHVKVYQSWLRSAVSKGSLGESFLFPGGRPDNCFTMVILPRDSVEGSMSFKRADLFLGTDSSHMLSNLPPAAAKSSPWHVTLTGFAASASNLDILLNAVPRRLVPFGVSFQPLSHPTGRSVTLVFESEEEIKWYKGWIKWQFNISLDLKRIVEGSRLEVESNPKVPSPMVSMATPSDVRGDSILASPLNVAVAAEPCSPASLHTMKPATVESHALACDVSNIKPAAIHDPRVLICDFVPTLSDAEIFSACSNGDAAIKGATFYSPLPLGPGRSKVRSVLLAFDKPKNAKLHIDWLKQAASAGDLADKVVTPVLSVNMLPAGISPGDLMHVKAAAAAAMSDSPLPFSPDPSSLAAVPSAASVPSDLPDADDAAWRLTVGNLRDSFADKSMVANIIPDGIQLIGATLHALKPLGVGRPELARFVTLAFETEVEANLCGLWIKHHSKPGGCVAKMIVRTASIYMNHSCKPPQANSTTRSIASSASTPPHSSSSDMPAAQPVTPPPAIHRVTIGNLLDHLTKNQLLSALVPAGVSLVDMHLLPLKSLAGRPEKARFVQLKFESQRDLQLTNDWIKDQAVAGGSVAKVLVPNTNVTVTGATLAATSPTEPFPSSPTVPHPSTPLASHEPDVLGAIDALPEASTEHYRLHVSNLKPDLELVHIIPVLVPRGIKLAGATLLEPRSLSGLRHEVVRSLKLAFYTESDAKQCLQWIKQDVGGGVSKLALPGAHLVVGNPMDPMMADPPTHPFQPLSRSRTQSPVPKTQRVSPTLPSLASEAPSPTPSRQVHVSVTGIDSSKPVSSVFSTILDSLTGPVEPVRMGVRSANGRLTSEFVFDSEAVADQFVLQVRTGIKAGMYAGLTADGRELKVVTGNCRRGGSGA